MWSRAAPELLPSASAGWARPPLYASQRSYHRDCDYTRAVSTRHPVAMPADRLLSTLLRSLQTYTDQQDTPRYASLLLIRIYPAHAHPASSEPHPHC